MFIILAGDVVNGICPIGPFETIEEAQEVMEFINAEAVITDIVSPEELSEPQDEKRADPFECDADCENCNCKTEDEDKKN